MSVVLEVRLARVDLGSEGIAMGMSRSESSSGTLNTYVGLVARVDLDGWPRVLRDRLAEGSPSSVCQL